MTKLPRGHLVTAAAGPDDEGEFVPRPADFPLAGQVPGDVIEMKTPSWKRPEYARHRATGRPIGIAIVHVIAGLIWAWRGLRWGWRRWPAVVAVVRGAVDRLKSARGGREEV